MEKPYRCWGGGNLELKLHHRNYLCRFYKFSHICSLNFNEKLLNLFNWKYLLFEQRIYIFRKNKKIGKLGYN